MWTKMDETIQSSHPPGAAEILRGARRNWHILSLTNAETENSLTAPRRGLMMLMSDPASDGPARATPDRPSFVIPARASPALPPMWCFMEKQPTSPPPPEPDTVPVPFPVQKGVGTLFILG